MKTFTRRAMYAFILGLFFASPNFAATSEELVITTYYPSPYGSYRDLRADYLGVGSTYRGTSLSDGNMVISGNLGINTTTLSYRLNVNGDINVMGEILQSGVPYDCCPDYVFEPTYNLMSIAQLKRFVSDNRHLPGMPSAAEVRQEGVKLFEQNRQLLEKIEEAYLYIIQLEERIAKLEARQGK